MADEDVQGSGTQGWAPAGQPVGPTPPAPSPYETPGSPQPGYTQPSYPQPVAAPQPTYPQPVATPQPGYPQPGAAPQASFNQQGPYPPQAPYPPAAGYGQQGYYGQAPAPKTPAIAIVGLILAFIIPPVGLIVSLVAVGRARRAGKGKGLTIAGIVVGALLTLAGALMIPLVVNQVSTMGDAKHGFETMQNSLADNDCDAFMASTTPRFQEQLGVASCDDFAVLVKQVTQGPVPFGNVPITGVKISGDTATVTTLERMPTGEGTATKLQNFDYTVVHKDGKWLVDFAALAN